MKLFVTLFAVGCLLGNAQAQETLSTAGGDISGSNGSMSYALGQLVFTKNTGSNGSVNQGIQYNYQIEATVLSAEPDVSISLFPNPVDHFLNLELDHLKRDDLSYRLIDLQGKIIANEKVLKRKTQIPVGKLQEAVYILHIMNQNKKVQSFKIIKRRHQ